MYVLLPACSARGQERVWGELLPAVYSGPVLFLEEDHVLSPDALTTLRAMIKAGIPDGCHTVSRVALHCAVLTPHQWISILPSLMCRICHTVAGWHEAIKCCNLLSPSINISGCVWNHRLLLTRGQSRGVLATALGRAQNLLRMHILQQFCAEHLDFITPDMPFTATCGDFFSGMSHRSGQVDTDGTGQCGG
jgi:hypothetical protein